MQLRCICCVKVVPYAYTVIDCDWLAMTQWCIIVTSRTVLLGPVHPTKVKLLYLAS